MIRLSLIDENLKPSAYSSLQSIKPRGLPDAIYIQEPMAKECEGARLSALLCSVSEQCAALQPVSMQCAALLAALHSVSK